MKSVIRERCKCIVGMDPDPDLFRQAKEKLLEEANKDIEFDGQCKDLLEKFNNFFEDSRGHTYGTGCSTTTGKQARTYNGLISQNHPKPSGQCFAGVFVKPSADDSALINPHITL